MNTSFIKAIVLDVDGVIVGERIGVNSPIPNPLVSKKLREINNSGIAVHLCTAKPLFSIKDVIDDIGLHNSHIADAGALILAPFAKKPDFAERINKDVVKKIVSKLISNAIYTEVYNEENYFIDNTQYSKTTEIHSQVLQKQPVYVDGLVQRCGQLNIIKIMPVVEDPSQITIVEKLLNELQKDNSFNLSWGVHPIALPRQFGIITNKGVSKRDAVIKLFNNSHIDFQNVLAIGDSKSDWQFMELCEFVGTVANSDEQLKALVMQREPHKRAIGSSVDDNGILDILEHFSL